ncbi:unnamed protein product [Citrullus colocynthis]|uniref:Uncharacterized protein n=1 Tax=Citrullus colocynthis TaxID=252529 RepID=A0ABP0XQ48_9ROSI
MDSIYQKWMLKSIVKNRVEHRSNLPDLVQPLSIGREAKMMNRLSADSAPMSRNGKGKRWRRKNRGVGRNVEGADGRGVAGEGGDEGLRSDHANGGGAGRRGEKGDGERGIFGIVGIAEKGVELGKIFAVGERSVGEGLRRANEGLGLGLGLEE